MSSVESIGACSLDLEASANESLASKDVTASACTLLSNGASPSMQEARNGDTFHDEMSSFDQRPSSDNQARREFSVAEIKLPSYLSISCAINGYTNYSRFCRSRDNSPARLSFRKSSLEHSMLGGGQESCNGQQAVRYSRSQSDCNGTMQSIYTESRRILVNKQLQIPLKSSRQYTTEVSIGNGHSETLASQSNDTEHSPTFEHSGSHVHSTLLSGDFMRSIKVTDRTSLTTTNGHSDAVLSLSKEVGNGGTKSLVQQRIESLYGKSAVEEVLIKSSSKCKDHQINGVEEVDSNVKNGRNHIGSVSPPVFRHLNKDFRKQLQLNAACAKKSDLTKPPKLSKTTQNEITEFSISNGVDHDECDRVKSMTPPPLKSEAFDGIKCSIADSEREGYRFLSLADTEMGKIQEKVAHWESLMKTTQGIPEEALGVIRAACGKANLLLSQKFEQFKELCWKNIKDNPTVPFYTNGSDLAGFWDLVLLQVEDIHSTFTDISAMKENRWQKVVSEKPKVPQTRVRNPNIVSRSNPSTPKKSPKSAEVVKAREEARKQFLAARKKEKQQSIESDITIFTSGSS